MLPPHLNDREQDKFIDDTVLGTAVKTLTKIFGSASAADLQLDYLIATGADLEQFTMVNDSGEILRNDNGQLLRKG